jgi:hypothetical protein
VETHYRDVTGLDHPKEIIEKLQSSLLPKGSVQIASQAIAWATYNNKQDLLSHSEHFIAHQKRFEKNKNISNIHLNGILYLNSLSAKYSEIIREFLSKEVFTAEDVYQKVQGYELISASAKSHSTSGFGSAFLAAPLETGPEDQAFIASSSSRGPKKGHHNPYNPSTYQPASKRGKGRPPRGGRGGHGGRGGQGGRNGGRGRGAGKGRDTYKNGLLNDYWNHPNDPTEFERTKTCHRCHLPGHIDRTCHKRVTSQYKESGYLMCAFDFDTEPDQPSNEWYQARDAHFGYDNDDYGDDNDYDYDDDDVNTNVQGALYLSQQHLSALLFFTLIIAVAIKMFPPISNLDYS